jgi:hypothetical protein
MLLRPRVSHQVAQRFFAADWHLSRIFFIAANDHISCYSDAGVGNIVSAIGTSTV